MAEKWDDSANDSPEVVYEGFSPPPTHPQGMINSASSSFVAADGNEDGSLGGSAAAFMQTGALVENQGEGSHHEEIERNRLCFVCCNPVSDKNYESIKASMNHSHAPLLVLLTDVLGYKLEDGRLHSQVVCKACYHLLDIIDELQQTLAESKTDVRTKFLETIQKLKLKYPRTDKMLKPRCLRCIQMSQTTARKRGKGRGWKGRSDDVGRSRGRGRGRGRVPPRSEDGHDIIIDHDGEGQRVTGEEVIKDALPSKSHHLRSYQLDTEIDSISQMKVMNGNLQSVLETDLCSSSCVGFGKIHNVSCDRKNEAAGLEQSNAPDNFQSVCNQFSSYLMGEVSPFKCLETAGENYSETHCNDCSYLEFYECSLCRESQSGVLYLHCETCQTCNGIFVPWGCNIDLEFTDDKCCIWDLKVQNHLNQGKMHIVSHGSKYAKYSVQNEIVSDKYQSQVGSQSNQKNAEELSEVLEAQENRNLKKNNDSISHNLVNFESIPVADAMIKHIKDEIGDKNTSTGDILGGIASVESLMCEQNEKEICVQRNSFAKITDSESISAEQSFFKGNSGSFVIDENKTVHSDFEGKDSETSKSDFLQLPSISDTSSRLSGTDNTVSGGESITGSTYKDDVPNDLEDSYIVVRETLLLSQDAGGPAPKNSVSECLFYKANVGLKQISTAEASETVKSTKIFSEPLKVSSRYQDLQDSSEESNTAQQDRKTLANLFTEISSHPSQGKRKRRLTAKAKEIIADNFEPLATDRKSRKSTGRANSAEVVNYEGSIKHLDKDGVQDCKYMCEYCGKRFNSAGGFRYHVVSHEVDKAKVFACGFCNYTTRRQADLRKHSVIHTGEKHYKCEVCSQEFTVNSSYKRHLRIHSGEKPYKCRICGKDFRNGSALKQHMVKHTGAKNFVCEVCGNSFSLRHHYTAHHKLHTGELPFKCLYCGTAFRNHSSLRHHRKKTHPKEEASRLKQVKLKRTIVREELGVRTPPGVVHGSLDVLEQAMAATVDPVNYEYVDSYTQTLPDVDSQSVPVVSEIITERLSSKDSVVFAITNLDEGEIKEETVMSNNKPCIESDIMGAELQESSAAVVSVDECGEEHELHQNIKVFPGSFCSDDTVNVSQEFMVLKSDEQPPDTLKSDSIEVVSSNNTSSRSGTSQMYIMLSDAQVQDPRLYIVVENDSQTHN